MRVAPFPASSSQSGRCLAAILALWLAGTAAAGANEIAANAVSGFAEQKIDGMTLTVAPGSSAALVEVDFHVNTSTQAASDSSPDGAVPGGGLDALRSLVAGTMPLQAAEDFIGSASSGMSLSAGEWILRQLDATAPDVGSGFSLANPPATAFLAGRCVACRDRCTTPNADAYPVSRSKSEKIPSDWTMYENRVSAASLGPGMPPIDRVAEAVLEGQGIVTLASGTPDQAVTAGFRIDGVAGARTADPLDFNLVERLVVHSWNPESDMATASNAFALEIGDATGRSVFGPFLGTDPSVTRMFSSAAATP